MNLGDELGSFLEYQREGLASLMLPTGPGLTARVQAGPSLLALLAGPQGAPA